MFEDNKDIIKSDLEKLALILSNAGVCEDTTPIQQAIGNSFKYSTEEFWRYKIANLKFKLEDSFSHCLPEEVELLGLTLTVDLIGFYTTDKYTNPFQKMQLDIEIEGLDANAELCYAAWHFDKHEEGKNSQETKLIHPEYHFTFGGTKMWERPGMNWGTSLILPTPRFAYPPMDGILGIDFVLGNYLKKDKRLPITRDPEYKEIIKRSQIRAWRPYFMSISNAWASHSNSTNTMEIEKIMPNLVYKDDRK